MKCASSSTFKQCNNKNDLQGSDRLLENVAVIALL